MIDGIKLLFTIKDFSSWRTALPFNLDCTFNDVDGEIKTRVRSAQTNIKTITTEYKGNFETYFVTATTVKKSNAITNEILDTYTIVLIKGSLHKNFYGGANYMPFTFIHMQTEIQKICKVMQVGPELVKIQNIEFGLNIPTSFVPIQFIKDSLVNYRQTLFTPYAIDKNGICLGAICKNIKAYDKGLQYGLAYNLMRYELRYTKMQFIKNFKTLKSLQDAGNVYQLITKLLAVWNEILIYDVDVNIKTLPIHTNSKQLLRFGQYGNYWQKLAKKVSGKTLAKYKNNFRFLVKKYGINTQDAIAEKIKIEWQKCFEGVTNLPSAKPSKKIVRGNKFTDTVKGKYVTPQQVTPTIKTCLGCGDALHPNQRSTSLFCSAKIVGYSQAHKCRNDKNNFKYKIANEKKTKGEFLFEIVR